MENVKKGGVLITGGSRGIGAEMVRAFRREGYEVAFTYRSSQERAEALSKETGAFSICADSASETAVREAVERATDLLGEIDVLVNNAAIAGFRLFTDITGEEWRHFLDVNLNGAFYYTQGVLPRMISRKYGRIINIASMWGICGASCEVHYSTTKAALIGMTKALASELGPSGITVNAIAPGVIDTEMNGMLSSEDIRALEDQTPLCRIGKPADVATAALFLAGEGGSFITGQVLGVNGGFLM